ncbi:MAG: UDP-N-acetylmuramoyl-L-alanyl-D-glutamate--2,6-diaminopimelate ligase [Clostridium sp.]
MKLVEILNNIKYELIKGTEDLEVNKIAYDSRKVEANDIFVCVKGYATDGHKYIDTSLNNGAKVIVVQDYVEVKSDVTVIKCEDTRKALAQMACNFYDSPSKKMKMIGVTGTNGKTTTAFMIKNILEESGKKVGLIGTIANFIGDKKLETERTTPESLELQELFKNMVDEGVEYCVMEVSSHSLDLDRVYGVEFNVGIFSNLTRDHLDFHKTFENYFNAKYKLFERSSINIINIDDNYGKEIVERLSKYDDKKVISYSEKSDSNYKPYNVQFGSREINFDLNMPKEEKFKISIPGAYNLYNGLSAMLACYELGVDVDAIKKGIEKAQVPGRCERTAIKYKLPYDIIIDYAHSPDGLDNILKTAKEFTKNRLISVFGCGGDRDKVKRPQMGKIGSDLSDIAIITSDNPRTEEPKEIISDIVKGIEKDNYIIEVQRADAIKKAIEIAMPGDVIVIAGKGHETYQIFKDQTIHFDEREVIEEILSK